MDTYDFFQRSLEGELRLMCRQCVLFFPGKRTFPLKRYRGLKIFTLDTADNIKCRIKRLNERNIMSDEIFHIPSDFHSRSWMLPLIAGGFDPKKKSFTLLDLSCLSFEHSQLEKIIGELSVIMSEGSALCIETKNSDFSADELENLLQSYFIQVYDIENTALYCVKIGSPYTLEV